MTQINLHQLHHVIEQQAFDKSPLLQQLAQRNLFNVDNPRNLLNLPESKELAAKLGVSPHKGGPLGAYSKELAAELGEIQKSPDYQRILSGDKLAAQRLATRVNGLMDTLKAGLVNGHLFTNTPKGLTKEATNARIKSFFGDLDGYASKHAAQIGKLGKMPAPEAKWAAALKSQKALETTVDALQKAGVKLGKGPAAAALEELAGAVVVSGKQSLLSGTSLTTLKSYYASLPAFVRNGVRVAGPAATALGITVSVAEAAQQARAGDTNGAVGTLARLAGALYFGAKGMTLGAAGGSAAGPLGAIIGGVIGGVAGAVGGDAAVGVLMDGANKLIDTVSSLSRNKPSGSFNFLNHISERVLFAEIKKAIKGGERKLNTLAKQVSVARASGSSRPNLGSALGALFGGFGTGGGSSGHSGSGNDGSNPTRFGFNQNSLFGGGSRPGNNDGTTHLPTLHIDSNNNSWISWGDSGGGSGGLSQAAQNAVANGHGGLYPVVLDLDGDGALDIRPLDPARADGPAFDADGDGKPNRIAWVGPGDGLLAIDLGADGEAGPDGIIDQAREIAFALWKTEDEIAAENGREKAGANAAPVTDLEGLRWAFDTNGDTILDHRDARWSEFRIWQDHNQNGISDPGELRTMEEAGIALINLLPSAEGAKLFGDGSAITGTSAYRKMDGTAGMVGDVVLAYQPN